MPVCIMRHSGSLELERSIGTATSGQRIAIESTTKAVDHINEIMSEMARGVTQMAESSLSIFDNAETLVRIAEKATGRQA